MSRSPETETPTKKRKGASVVVWILLAMLIAGLGGFGVTSFSGGSARIGTVGDKPVELAEYTRAVQSELAALSAQMGQPVSFRQSEEMGLGTGRRALSGLVLNKALDNEADRIGISVGDAIVAEELQRIDAFHGLSGTFDRETYRMQLQATNQNESDFENGLRADIARSLLQGAVARGFVAPAAMTDTLLSWAGERRGFSLLRLGEGDLTTPLPTPTEAELEAYHGENIDRFTRPEAKRITYVALLPEMLAADMPVDDTLLRQSYDDRIAEFVQPERRLVERLVYPSEEEAAEAKARLDAGTPFETLVADRGLTLVDIDLGDLGREDLGEAADAVFALTEPGVVGPLPSEFGPALYRMNGILAAQETSFEEAREGLVAELQADSARRAIADRVEAIDDALAGGATLEELQTEEGMQLQTIDYVPEGDNTDPLAGYEAFREAADAVAEGDFPEAVLLDDGGIVALRLDEIVPAAPIPFAEAREDVAAAWRADQLAKALSDRAIEIKAAAEGGASLGSFGIVDVTTEIARDGFVENVPATFLPAVFAMAEGEFRVIEVPGFTGIVRLDRILPADMKSEDAAAMREGVAAQVAQSIANDAFSAFATALMNGTEVSLDQATIDAVNAQFP